MLVGTRDVLAMFQLGPALMTMSLGRQMDTLVTYEARENARKVCVGFTVNRLRRRRATNDVLSVGPRVLCPSHSASASASHAACERGPRGGGPADLAAAVAGGRADQRGAVKARGHQERYA